MKHACEGTQLQAYWQFRNILLSYSSLTWKYYQELSQPPGNAPYEARMIAEAEALLPTLLNADLHFKVAEPVIIALFHMKALHLDTTSESLLTTYITANLSLNLPPAVSEWMQYLMNLSPASRHLAVRDYLLVVRDWLFWPLTPDTLAGRYMANKVASWQAFTLSHQNNPTISL